GLTHSRHSSTAHPPPPYPPTAPLGADSASAIARLAPPAPTKKSARHPPSASGSFHAPVPPFAARRAPTGAASPHRSPQFPRLDHSSNPATHESRFGQLIPILVCATSQTRLNHLPRQLHLEHRPWSRLTIANSNFSSQPANHRSHNV